MTEGGVLLARLRELEDRILVLEAFHRSPGTVTMFKCPECGGLAEDQRAVRLQDAADQAAGIRKKGPRPAWLCRHKRCTWLQWLPEPYPMATLQPSPEHIEEKTDDDSLPF